MTAGVKTTASRKQTRMMVAKASMKKAKRKTRTRTKMEASLKIKNRSTMMKRMRTRRPIVPWIWPLRIERVPPVAALKTKTTTSMMILTTTLNELAKADMLPNILNLYLQSFKEQTSKNNQFLDNFIHKIFLIPTQYYY